jgi:RNA-directed DNA polymerase
MRIIHTLSPGFTFFRFDIFQQIKWVKVSKLVQRHNSNLQFITIIIPSKDSLKKHKLQIREIIQRYRGASQERLIQKLNPVIFNWAMANRTPTSSKTFQLLDQFVFLHLWKWGKSRHPMMSNYKLKKKYWHNVGTKNWLFGVEINNEIILQLQLHSKIPSKFIGLSYQKEVF